MTESLDYVPGRFKVVRHLREAFSCRTCETVVQAPAPYHAIARGRAGPGLLAHIAVAKFERSPASVSSGRDLCAGRRHVADLDPVRLMGATARRAGPAGRSAPRGGDCRLGRPAR